MTEAKTKQWIKILDDAMDDQVALLEADINDDNPLAPPLNSFFTRKRIVRIWKWRKAALAELCISQNA